MGSTLPSQNAELLKTFVRKRIAAVRRQIFIGDMDLDDYEQNADGPIELMMDDNCTIHFSADTETFSVSVSAGTMPPYGDSYTLVDVSRNSFWSGRIGQEIIGISLLKSRDWSMNHPGEFGIEFLLEDGKRVFIEYLDQEEHPDMIRVTDFYSGRTCLVHSLRSDYGL